MKDLYHAINALNNIVNESKQLLAERDKPEKPNVPSYNSIGDMVKAIKTPGRQGVADPNQSAANIAAAQPKPAAKPTLGGTGVGRQDGPGLPKPAAPKINPAVPAAGPVRANPINPQAMAATKAAASVVNAPKQAAQAPKPAAQAPTPAAVPVPKPKPAEPVAAPSGVPLNPQGGERVTYQSLAKASGIADPNKIRPGQEIKLPGGGTYKVQSGDTLSGIAQNVRLGNIGAPKPAPTGTARKVSTVAPDAAPAAQANRAQSQGGRTAQQAASAPQAPPQDAQAARVAQSNAALAGDAEKAKKATSGMIDAITGGISDLFKPSPNSAIGKRQAAALNRQGDAMDQQGDAMAAAITGSTQSGVSARPGPSLSDVTAAGNARFGDPLQKARDARDAQQQTTSLQGSGKQIPANIQKKIDARRADIANRYEPDADGNYSLSNPPRQPGTSFRASDGTNTVARDASGNLNVRQRVTDPEAQQALINRVNRAREMQRLALAAGSTDPDDIRAYVNRMNRTQGTGAAGGTDMNTF
jgi:LysM repeat protein